MALFLAVGNLAFRHFEPFMSITRHLLKSSVILAITALISYCFGRTGVIIAVSLAFLPLLIIHAIWLPRQGVNSWTAEPRENYYALRGWPPPPREP